MKTKEQKFFRAFVNDAIWGLNYIRTQQLQEEEMTSELLEFRVNQLKRGEQIADALLRDLFEGA